LGVAPFGAAGFSAPKSATDTNTNIVSRTVFTHASDLDDLRQEHYSEVVAAAIDIGESLLAKITNRSHRRSLDSATTSA
jgi:hypothetical protein